MQKKLDTVLERQLAIRVEIAVTTEVFTHEELAKGFEMSLSTLRRYINPDAREVSRVYARRQHQERAQSRKIIKGNCYKCLKPLQSHNRCVCEILLHGKEHCGSVACIETMRRDMMTV